MDGQARTAVLAGRSGRSRFTHPSIYAMNLQFQFDQETAVRVTELLEQDGMLKAAADMWWRMSAVNPYDRRPREKVGDLSYEHHQAAQPLGSFERSRFILRVIGISFPTPKLTNAYFDNLNRLLASRQKRTLPGALVLGAGAGRCGSTSLAGAFAALPGACATHENPPPLFWKPLAEQMQPQLERFRLLTQYYAVVFDAAHWWINVLDQVFKEFPDTKVVGLQRETDTCVGSFVRMKGTGRGTLNHWATPGNGIWATSPGDPLYPSYAVPASSVSDPDGAKAALIGRYVTEYNQKLQQTAKAHPDRVMLVRTEDLNNVETFARMSEFLNLPLAMPAKALNVGNTSDSNKLEMTF
jgi:hypothetical protein